MTDHQHSGKDEVSDHHYDECKNKFINTLENDKRLKELLSIQPIIFTDTCCICGEDYDDRENNLGLESGICKKCNIERLEETSCKKTKKKLCNNLKCKLCYTKSFASSDRAIHWSPENENITPRQIHIRSNINRWIKCPVCNHNFEKSPDKLTKGWCPFCSNYSLCDNNCEICFLKSFESCEISKYWSSENGAITPRQISKYSGEKYLLK